MTNHQKINQVILDQQIEAPVENQVLENFAMFLNINGQLVNVSVALSSLSDRILALEEA
jgi:hypothetical protein